MESQIQTQQFTEQQVKAVQAAFITRVYAWMSLALGLTGVVAYYTSTSETILSFIFSNMIVFWGLIIGELLLVGWMTGLVAKISAQTATVVFIIYALINGLTLSFIFLLYTMGSIASTFFITAGTFGIMSIVGYFTKTDLSELGKVFMMALIGLILASVVNWFLKSETLYWLTTYIGVAVIVGLVAYDTQKLKEMSIQMNDETMVQKGAILGALSLYLDFINLFLFLLRIFGRRR